MTNNGKETEGKSGGDLEISLNTKLSSFRCEHKFSTSNES